MKRVGRIEKEKRGFENKKKYYYIKNSWKMKKSLKNSMNLEKINVLNEIAKEIESLYNNKSCLYGSYTGS